MLENLHMQKKFKRMRESSYNPTGGNADFVAIKGRNAHSLPILQGPGIIRHIWLTLNSESVNVYREIEMVMHFDGAENPQVHVPLADFFLFGHGLLVDVNSIPIQVSRQPHLNTYPYSGGMNCVFSMPFAEAAKIEFRNCGNALIKFFYYVDWESHEALPEPVMHFHATLNEENTKTPERQIPQLHNSSNAEIINKSWKENYTFLDVDGYEGHYVGTGLSIECKPGCAGKWWEGDDMFAIDGEDWPPRLHGTGTEDYFNLAWGFRKVECRPEYGITCIEKKPKDVSQIDGRFSMYRFHINDPIPFTKSICASIEHGHANDCEAYYRSVAYWYGRKIR